MPLRQPIIHRRRQQKPGLPIHVPKIAHPPNRSWCARQSTLPHYGHLCLKSDSLLAAAIFGGYRWFFAVPALPPGIAFGNGRLEADTIDIDTKFAGRIAKLFVDEGDMVAAGQAVAAMDTRDIAASLKKSEALVEQAQRALDEA